MRSFLDPRQPAAEGPWRTRHLRKLVRSRLTKQFLSHKGTWVKDAVDAVAFTNRPQARAAVADLGLNPLDLDFYFFFRDRKSRLRDFTVRLL